MMMLVEAKQPPGVVWCPPQPPTDLVCWTPRPNNGAGEHPYLRVGGRRKIATTPEVPARGNDWIARTLKRLRVVAELPANWDDEGSAGTNPTMVLAAYELLRRICLADDIAVPVPDVCPIPGGGFQFEWNYGRKSLELEFVDEATICFLTARQTPEGEILTSGEYPQRLLGETLRWLEWLMEE